MTKKARITIEVEIYDEAELARHATDIAALGGLMVDDWKEMREAGDTLRADLIMIFDPGISPPGVAISGSGVEIEE